jgi:hypothetical protein
VTRSNIADKIIKDGINSGDINVKELSLDRFLFSQKGSFNHRQSGLQFRLKQFAKIGKLLSPKRDYGIKEIGIDFKLVQIVRLNIRRKSLAIWRKEGSPSKFNKEIKKELLLLKFVTKLYHIRNILTNKGALRIVLNKLKNYFSTSSAL